METPASASTASPKKRTPKAKGACVVSVYFLSRDLEIFKASLFDDNGGSFVGSRQRVAQIRQDNPDFNSAWERMEARKREKYGEEKCDKLPQGKPQTTMINIKFKFSEIAKQVMLLTKEKRIYPISFISRKSNLSNWKCSTEFSNSKEFFHKLLYISNWIDLISLR